MRSRPSRWRPPSTDAATAGSTRSRSPLPGCSLRPHQDVRRAAPQHRAELPRIARRRTSPPCRSSDAQLDGVGSHARMVGYSPRTRSPPTLPHPKPSSDTSRPVLPVLLTLTHPSLSLTTRGAGRPARTSWEPQSLPRAAPDRRVKPSVAPRTIPQPPVSPIQVPSLAPTRPRGLRGDFRCLCSVRCLRIGTTPEYQQAYGFQSKSAGQPVRELQERERLPQNPETQPMSTDGEEPPTNSANPPSEGRARDQAHAPPGTQAGHDGKGDDRGHDHVGELENRGHRRRDCRRRRNGHARHRQHARETCPPAAGTARQAGPRPPSCADAGQLGASISTAERQWITPSRPIHASGINSASAGTEDAGCRQARFPRKLAGDDLPAGESGSREGQREQSSSATFVEATPRPPGRRS